MNDKKTSEQVMRKGLEDIVFFSRGCYDSDYFANIAKKALEESDRLKLSIPKKIAEELEELTGKTNWESTPYSVVEENGKINTWAYLGHGKCSEQLYKFCRDNTRLMHAYLNPLTRPFVEVEG